MKEIIILCLFCSPFLVFGQESYGGQFTIEGNIKNFGDGLLIGTITDTSTQSVRLDTISVRHDFFSHLGKVEVRQIVKYKAIGDQFAKYRKLVKDNDSVMVDLAEDKSRSLEVVISAGAYIKVSGIASAYLAAYPTGTEENQHLAELNQKIYPLYNEIGELKTKYSKKTYDSLSRRENALFGQINDIVLRFIKKHPSSMASSFVVFEKFEPLNEKDPMKADSLYQLIKPLVMDFYYQKMMTLKSARTAGKVRIAVGDLFPLFEAKTIYGGNSFSLDQALGKYTLIDFWGSWCIPCVKEMPKLYAYYVKFKDKLNVVGVAKDKYQNWKAFLDNNHYPWVQVLDQDVPSLSDRLQVEVYPTKYLLDPDGKVLMIFRDSNEQIWEALDELFKAY